MGGASWGLNAPPSIDFNRVGHHKPTHSTGRRGLPFVLRDQYGATVLGECPERQRGRTVNPLAYAFVGSSPTSPTIAEFSPCYRSAFSRFDPYCPQSKGHICSFRVRLQLPHPVARKLCAISHIDVMHRHRC